MHAELEDPPKPSGFWHAFAQQRLQAWQPALAAKWIILFYVVLGIGFIVLGCILLDLSRSVYEYTVDYTTHASVDRSKPEGQRTGHFEIRIEAEMRPPIWVYYELDDFHQNHRRYVNSRSNAQMGKGWAGNAASPELSVDGLDHCDPWITTGSRVNYPCGLVARSLFNDSFRVSYKGPYMEDSEYKRIEVDQRALTIAWAADVKTKFKNINPEAVNSQTQQANQVDLNMWILNRFPPEECEQIDITLDRNGQSTWKPVRVRSRQVASMSGGAEAKVSVADCGNYSGKASCSFETLDGEAFDCSGTHRRQSAMNWGIENGHFMVWMRIAGLPHFRKLWGKIDRKLEAGSSLLISFTDDFPVQSFHGSKAFVISTSSILGGRNPFLGWGYIAVGIACLLLGLAYLYRHKMMPASPDLVAFRSAWQQGHSD